MKRRTISTAFSALRSCFPLLLGALLFFPAVAAAGIGFGLPSAVRSAVKKLPPRKTGPPVAVDNPPVIASLTAVPASLSTGAVTAITCAASDADGDALTYSWSAASGTITGSGRQISWTAPGSRGTFEVSVAVSDGRGGSAAGSINIGVALAGYSVPAEGFETGDFSKLPWIAGGDAGWIVEGAVKHGGNYGAQAGPIGDSEESDLSLVADVAQDGDITFYRKVSSELDYDFLEFYIDGDYQDGWSGEADWEAESYAVTAGTHTFKWIYSKDSSGASGSDTGWIDDILFPDILADHPPVISTMTAVPASVSTGAAAAITCSASDVDSDTTTYSWSAASGNITGTGLTVSWTAPDSSGTYTIGVTVSDGRGGSADGSIDIDVLPVLNEDFETGDLSKFAWTAGGDAPWVVQSSVAYGGTYAAQAGPITDNQTSVLSVLTAAPGSGTLSFNRKVSSDAGDLLGFYIDGVLQGSWSGELDWAAESYPLAAGLHTLKWVYSKDGSGAAGSDTAWIDNVVFSGY